MTPLNGSRPSLRTAIRSGGRQVDRLSPSPPSPQERSPRPVNPAQGGLADAVFAHLKVPWRGKRSNKPETSPNSAAHRLRSRTLGDELGRLQRPGALRREVRPDP
ncbi:hypothetical protein AAFF_G00087600 [Aldrovandia affinis]|uniref:Uncharacterized protein n=1 Tax=Aldrovandia affinis TaxID=143900 RepID=A0AAD7WD65_9TELE|nr:hypothetical protein AAFF_G00087600 [Aldrovandia affinis]